MIISHKSKAEYLADFLCRNADVLAQELTNQSCDNLVMQATTKPLSFTEISSWFKGES
ncbi:MAG: hypothetical protein JKX78_04910 [Alteromonadaceae bacterium]|nr:hypothetical protein [Alteromonadaceae bacterium]